jgi:transposase
MKLTKKAYKPPSNRPSPSLHTLLAAEARELLTTWEVLKDKDAIERHLASMDKKYKPGAEKAIRQWMHWIKKHERSTN